MSVGYHKHRDKLTLSITTAAGDGATTIRDEGYVTRSVFDGPNSAVYSWLVSDKEGKPVAGRASQVGDQIIVEEYPVQAGFTIEIIDSDTDGTWGIFLWLKP